MTDSSDSTNPSYDRKAAGERLRITRIALDLTEAQAATGFGVTVRTYRRYEAGRMPRYADPIIAFCSKHDISVDWLIVGDSSRLRRICGRVTILSARGAQRTVGAAS